MDVFNKFYTKAKPLFDEFLRARYKDIPVELQNEIDALLGKVILKCCAVYKKDILREKYSLDIPSGSPINQLPTSDNAYIKKIRPCEICGQTRTIHLCHVIPRSEGGDDCADNYLSLCATHHQLFDRHRLAKEEWDVIDWNGLNKKSQKYALKVRLKKHKKNWKNNKFLIAVEGCRCGGQDLTVAYEDVSERIEEGDVEKKPGYVVKKIKCNQCGKEHVEIKYKDMEYEWWQDWLKSQIIK